MAFWKRKTKDRYITLGLNEQKPATAPEPAASASGMVGQNLETPAALSPTENTAPPPSLVSSPTLEPVITGDQPTPPPARESHAVTETARPVVMPQSTPLVDGAVKSAQEPVKPASQPRPVPSRSPFQTSVLGLDLTIEELQAQEAALEQEFSTRFRRAISATRESLSETIDTVFQSRKKIDAELLDELEEALIAADIGVPTTLHILETVRRGIARNQINDIEALKQAIKD